MNSPKEDGARRVDGRPPTPPPSSGVQLEVAILAADHDAPGPEPAATDERPHRTVMVVGAEPDLHRYIRECLRERTDVRVLEAATVAAAVRLAAYLSPDLLIVDQPHGEILMGLLPMPVVLLVDGVPRGVPPEAGSAYRFVRPRTSAWNTIV